MLKIIPWLSITNRTITSCNVFLSKQKNDPGIRNRVKLFEDDYAKEEINNLQDIEDVETDFANVDGSYGDYKREKQGRKIHVGRMMTINKFFSGPKPPNMLTWTEKQEIKRLYAEDPEEWNLDVLAESFPATREIISKILKTKWIPQSVNKMKRRDAKVLENWKRLENGTLEAEPALLEHYKKFLGRREKYLEALTERDYEKLLPPKEPEKRWNNGQMSSILESYEKRLQYLEEKKLLIESGLENHTNIAILEKTNKEVVVDEETNAEEGSFRESLKSRRKRHVTLADLKEALNHNINCESKTISKPIHSVKNIAEQQKEVSSTNMKSFPGCPDKTAPVKSLVNDSFKTISPNNEVQQDFANKSTLSSRNVQNVQSNTTVVSDNRESQTSENTSLNSSSDNVSDKISNSNNTYIFNSEFEREEFEKESDSIEGTFFWRENVKTTNSEFSVKPTNKMVSLKARRRKEIKAPVDATSYPERIEIPMNKRGSGLTFQVNDCFYDDDGEFLYRVPGMNAKRT